MGSFLDLGTAGSVASLVSVVLGFVGGAWWRRVHSLIARDRETTLSLLGLFEVYRHLQRAEEVMGTILVGRGRSRRAALTQRQLRETQQARDGIIQSRQAVNTYFGFFHDLKMPGTDPLVRAARFYRSRGPLVGAVICYEQALAFSDDGTTLCDEDRRACVQGLQYCAIVLGEREEAARWAREAIKRNVEGCIHEEELLKWFVVYRFARLLRLVLPTRLGWRRPTIQRSGLRGLRA
jgi:hypothetical protein